MTIGVTLNDKHCYDDYGMWLTDVDISQPEVQTHYVQVPGRTGELDLTEALTGDVRYYNGTTTMTFQTAEKVCGRSWFEQLELIRADLHGKRVDFIFDDTNIMYSGRCEVSGTPTAGGIYEIQVAVTVDGSGDYLPFVFYSATDNSLNFYCGAIPAQGVTYEGKRVTAIYDTVEDTGDSRPPWDAYRTNIKLVMFDASFKHANPLSCYQWFYSFSNCTAIDGIENLNTARVEFMYQMFYDCSSLTAVDTSNFKTPALTLSSGMFYGCTGLTTLDVSSFDTSKVTNMSSMFYGCTSLATIYSDDANFVTTSVTLGTRTFGNCSKLVGGNGTKYSSSKTDHTMAHIDTDDNPGYFTGK